MRILLTGSAGFIGQRLKDTLVNHHAVTGFDLEYGDDLRDYQKVDKALETGNYDTVIHCAALTGVRRGELYPREYMETNVWATKHLVEASFKHGIRHFVFFSSSSVYGADTKEPVVEDGEKHPLSVYGMTKLMGEHLVERSGLEYTIIRPFTVYGEHGRPDQVIMKWINQSKTNNAITLYGDGSSARGYTYVGDLVDAVKKVIENKITGTFNLGGDTLVRLKQLRKIFEEVLPDITMHIYGIQPGDPKYSIANTEKAQKTIGWKPKTKFSKKVKEIIEDAIQTK